MTEYEEGALAVLLILKQAREKQEAPLRRVDLGPAYVALNDLAHWGEALVQQTESEVMNHLIDRRKSRGNDP